MADIAVLKNIALNGTPADKQELFSFTLDESDERIILKYKLFARSWRMSFKAFENCGKSFSQSYIVFLLTPMYRANPSMVGSLTWNTFPAFTTSWFNSR